MESSTEEATETTTLLSNEPGFRDQVTEPDGIRDLGTTLRRYSSNCLPPYHDVRPPSVEPSSSFTVWTAVSVSLLGVFVANLDGSLVVASSQQIASEFNALSQASWLVTSFGLAQCASQALYGKLSDIFGRRSILVTAYAFFAMGCFLCGAGSSYWHILAGRAISGVGGAGMVALVSIIIVDVVPVRQVAAWRSYVNVAATTGRALGGPVGGWLCDAVGWRWCFYGQVPPTLLGLLLILWALPSRSRKPEAQGEEESLIQRVRRVDFAGAIFLALTISLFLILIHLVNEELPELTIILLGVLTLVSGALFYFIESRWAREPILPIPYLTNEAALISYILSGLQVAAQFSVFYSTPLYFQVVAGSSVSSSGARIVPAVVGNATAGILSGYIISRTGRYKTMTIISIIIGQLGYVLIFLRWRGPVKWVETLYISCGGFASGATQSTSFIHLAANMDPSEMAIAGTTLYLAQSLFSLLGIQLATAILSGTLKAKLNVKLDHVKHKQKIIHFALSSVKHLQELPPRIKEIVIQTYIEGLSSTFLLSVICSTLALVIGLTLKERRM